MELFVELFRMIEDNLVLNSVIEEWSAQNQSATQHYNDTAIQRYNDTEKLGCKIIHSYILIIKC